MYTTSHYTALTVRLRHEKQNLSNNPSSLLPAIWIKQIEKEIASEVEFLKSKGISVYDEDDISLSDDELLQELLK